MPPAPPAPPTTANSSVPLVPIAQNARSSSSLDNTSNPATPSPSPPPIYHGGKLRRFWLRNKGVLLVLLAQVFGSGMNVAARLMETDGRHGRAMHPFQILFARQSLTSILSLLYGIHTRIPHFPLGHRSVRALLLLRGLGGFFGVFGLYTSLLYLPLSEATVLTFLAPILTCYACSWVIAGERFSRGQQWAGWASLLGVVFIARPGFVFGQSPSPSPEAGGGGGRQGGNEGKAVVTSHQHTLAILSALLGVLGATSAMTSIRKIGTRAHPLISVNYFSSWCTIVSLVAVLVLPGVGFRLPGNMEEWGLLLLLGVFGFVMQFCLTAGLAYAGPESASGIKSAQLVVKDDVEDAVALGEGEEDEPSKSPSSSSSSSSGTRATSMLYTQMLFALFFDKLIWGLSPTGSSWVGSGIILACAIWVAAARDMQVRDNNKGVDAERGRKTAPHDDEEQQGLMNYNPFSPAAEAAESSEGNGMEQENANAESGRRTSS